MAYENVADTLLLVNGLFILGALVYFSYKIYSTRHMLGKRVLMSSIMLIVSGFAYAMAVFFPEYWPIFLIAILSPLVYILLAFTNHERFASVFLVVSIIVLSLYYALGFTPFKNTLIQLMLVVGLTTVAVIIALPLLIKKHSYVFFALTMILAIRYVMGIGIYIYPEYVALITFAGLIASSMYVSLYVSVFRKTYVAITALFLSMGLIGGITATVTAIQYGHYGAIVYFTALIFAAVALSTNITYYIRDYEASSSFGSLMFALSNIFIFLSIMMDMLLTLIYDVIDVIVPAIRYLNWFEFILLTLTELVLLGTGITLFGRRLWINIYSMAASSFVTFIAVISYEPSPQLEDILFIIFIAIILLTFAIFSYISFKVYKAGAKSAAIRFILYFVGLFFLSSGMILSVEIPLEEAAMLILVSGIIYMLSSPLISEWRAKKNK
ncbi:MAG: hypothetical protein ACP6IU_01915 [Candidatus Asgardarchaeia archaeon]